jgi:hypothetical protein
MPITLSCSEYAIRAVQVSFPSSDHTGRCVCCNSESGLPASIVLWWYRICTYHNSFSGLPRLLQLIRAEQLRHRNSINFTSLILRMIFMVFAPSGIFVVRFVLVFCHCFLSSPRVGGSERFADVESFSLVCNSASWC